MAWVTKLPDTSSNILEPVVSQNSYQASNSVAGMTISSLPKVLRIPKLSVVAKVESVGLDQQGKMDVPKEVADVGWYKLGFKPGEHGSAVMDGYLDTKTGAPAIFYNISQLLLEDEIIVEDEEGKEFKFRVIKKASYPYNGFPLQEVFASNGKARLNLITCVGEWDKSSQNYSQRMVVYSELVE